MSKFLQKIIKENKLGKEVGITSICSANNYVVNAVLLNAKKNDTFVLIESTSNQVNQFGGYTRMKPDEFRDFIHRTADSLRFPIEKIILGGDHLGPNTWQNEVSLEAMQKAEDQIASYVKAGFTKIHLDTSMPCADDEKNKPLSPVIISERAARLCKVAEETSQSNSNKIVKPLYIIGTDVPPPGGSKDNHDPVRITLADEVDETITLTRKAFEAKNLAEAWERVIGVVVQPGVEFGNSKIIEYDKDKAYPLKKKIKSITNGNLVYEAHSTDYQKASALRQMVIDHFAILKVGPWLTFAFREAVFALAKIEEELLSGKKSIKLSDIIKVVDRQMLAYPKYWEKYYNGDEGEKSFNRKFSYSDRIRYYWNNRKVKDSLQNLISNLSRHPLPLTLISQYLPHQYQAIREKNSCNNVNEIIYHKISEVLEIYDYAMSGSDSISRTEKHILLSALNR